MNKIKRVLFAGSVFSLLWITGCRDIEVATTVHQDGSLERTVTVRGDSSSLLGSKFPVPVEPVWTIRKEKEASGDKYVYTATRTFKDAGELNRYFDPDTAARIRLFVEVKKRFRWFSTFIGYREILRSQNPFRLVPYSDFLTEQELDDYFNDDIEEEKKEALEAKMEAWANHAVFEEFYQDMLSAAEKTGHPDLMRERIESRKDELFRATENWIEEDENNLLPRAMRVTREALGADAAPVLLPAVIRSVEKIKQKIAFLGADIGDSYTFSVTVPGLIVDTNSETIEGNRVSWKVENEDFFFRDHEMQVESRVVNRPIIALTLISGILAAVIVLAVIRKRK